MQGVRLVERTLVLVKPDGVARRLCGEVVGRLERAGLQICGARFLRLTDAIARDQYAEHVDKDFFADLCRFMTSGPVLALALAGDGAVARVRTLLGATDPTVASPGTIRHDLGENKRYNVVHGSATPADAERELAIYFRPEDLVSQ